jgi:2-keto-3-deoxy-L-rhamnonate aldolase RhmA
LAPHIATEAGARALSAACRYRGGRRGFANSTRAGRFGMSTFSGHMDEQDREIACIAMIEDLAAVDEIEAIVRVPGIDAIFIGRGDLTAALGAPSMTSDETEAVVAPIMAAARSAGMPIVMLCPDRKDAERMTLMGASAYIVGSDQAFMTTAARSALEWIRPSFAMPE